MDIEHVAGYDSMESGEEPAHAGSVHRLLIEEHRRLDALLEGVGACSMPGELQKYDEFRQTLLRHIGMEEKTLFLAAQRWRNGRALPQAAKLRLDHGAMVALLMPAPSAAVVRALRVILAAHNPIEDKPGGVYDICERLARDAGETDDLLRKLRETPQVPTHPNLTNPLVIEAAKRALIRAGYDPALLDE